MACPLCANVRLVDGERLTAAIRICAWFMSTPVTISVMGCSTCRVFIEEVERLVRPQKELDSPCTDVVNNLRRLDGGVAHLRARLVVVQTSVSSTSFGPAVEPAVALEQMEVFPWASARTWTSTLWTHDTFSM